jgi:ATP-binding cassette subfamily E protein 1
MRLAIVHKDKCKPLLCGHECEKCCPINKKGEECVAIADKAKIDEKLCIGCTICVKRCPLGAIDIVNLPSIKEENLVHRFGDNGFALYGLPLPKLGSVFGMLGRNGIGKSTAVEILAGKLKPNFGKKEEQDAVAHFKGTEFAKYFSSLDKELRVAYKPQNLSFLSVNLKVIDLLSKRGDVDKVKLLAKELGVEHLLENNLSKLSGGELQKIAIIASCLKEADLYFFDEPLAFLDISERLNVSDFIRKIAEGPARDTSLQGAKTVIVVEHDLLILDYLTEYLNIFYGQQGAFGLVSTVKSSTNGVNSYLDGFLAGENLRIRDLSLSFNFTKNSIVSGRTIAEWPDFYKKFDKFSLNVKAGAIKENNVVGILGKNGTGKTSFVKCLAGLEEVETADGKMKLDLDMKISYKPQYLFTDSEEMVRDVMFKEKISKKIASMFSLEVLHHKKIKNLSGGELQRFNIARCMAKEADIYLIDEPSAYLDVEERISCAKAIKDLMVEKGKTAFVVDHDLLLISYVADSVILFSGKSGIEGHSSEIYNFEKGVSELLKQLDITLRKDKETGRPRINKRGSVLDRQQREDNEWAKF